MAVALPLDKMTTVEKLRALEEIWDDLCRHAEDVPPPGWHGDVLRARESRVSEGGALFTAWDEAKGRIRNSTK